MPAYAPFLPAMAASQLTAMAIAQKRLEEEGGAPPGGYAPYVSRRSHVNRTAQTYSGRRRGASLRNASQIKSKSSNMPRRSYSRKRRRGGRRRVRRRRNRVAKIPIMAFSRRAQSTHFMEHYRLVHHANGVSAGTNHLDGGTIGGCSIFLDRLLNQIHWGTNATDTTYDDTVSTLDPTNWKTMNELYARYAVVSTFVSATYYNVRATTTVNHNTNDTDNNNAGHTRIPLVVGGYLQDKDKTTPPDDWVLQPHSKSSVVGPGESVTFTWRVTPATMHGRTDPHDNEYAASDTAGRITNGTDLRLQVSPISTGGTGFTENSGLWRVRIWQRAVWTEMKNTISFVRGDLP